MIFEKRGQWCFRDDNGKLYKYATEKQALDAHDVPVQVEEIKMDHLDLFEQMLIEEEQVEAKTN